MTTPTEPPATDGLREVLRRARRYVQDNPPSGQSFRFAEDYRDALRVHDALLADIDALLASPTTDKGESK